MTVTVSTLEFFDQSDRRSVREKRQRSLEAATYADARGLARVLVAEHHAVRSPSASPVQWATVIATRTERIRVGTGVSLLRLRNPYLTAVEFATLAAVCEGRIDVGVGRGDFRGPGAEVLDGLRRSDAGLTAAIVQLRDLLEHGSPCLAPVAPAPQFWLHGASEASAAEAVALGMHYCFGLFFRDDLDVARKALEQVAQRSPARTAVAVSMVANQVALRAAEDALGVRDVALNVVGGLAQCADTAARIVEHCGADELVLAELSSDVDDHLAALDGVAAAVGSHAVVRANPAVVS